MTVACACALTAVRGRHACVRAPGHPPERERACACVCAPVDVRACALVRGVACVCVRVRAKRPHMLV